MNSPSIWIHNIYDDLVEPALQFLGTGLFVMLPAHPRFVAAVTGSLPVGGLALRLVGTIVGLYSSIVAMRVIGLFYRHYKDRSPWTAE